MPKNLLILFVFLGLSTALMAQKQQHFDLPGVGPHLITYEQNSLPDYETVNTVLSKFYPMQKGYEWKPIATEIDAMGMSHVRGQVYFKGFKVVGSVLIVHHLLGKIKEINGHFYEVSESNFKLTRESAIASALKISDGIEFMWQSEAEELMLKQETNNPKATYYPTPEIVYVPSQFDFSLPYVACFEVKLYAKQPLSHKAFYINAGNGNLVAVHNLIHEVHDTGTATTVYSGKQTIYTDSTGAANFRLRDSMRSVITLNLKQGTNYGASVDFIDTDNDWNNVNLAKDEIATDAHWGAEMTYDYFLKVHNRKSFDNQGATIRSYVHYSTNYDNAFWDGIRMTYGDGNSFKPLTSIDVCGHEIAHAVTTYTANLIYSYESGALNESFSDIFGNTIEAWARPTQHSWIIGEDITTTGTGLRNMSNPNIKGHPKYYKGVSWYNGSGDNGGVHLNSGVQNYWYYLLAEGDTGVNEKGKSYSIEKLGFSKAEKIAYRNLSIYLSPSSNYAEARIYSIKSAEDLYGPCSRELVAITNAWYTVGVGDKFDSSKVSLDFFADTFACKTSQVVNFYNRSANFRECIWDFGDGDTSHKIDPSHQFNSYGNFDIKLKAKSCFNNNWDSLTKTQYVEIDSTKDICNAVLMPKKGTDSVNICSGFIYDEGAEGNYSQNAVTFLKVTSKGADSIEIQFLDLDYEKGFDTLTLYNGAPIKGNEIGKYFDSNLPNLGAPIKIYGDYISLRQWSDPYVVGRGFKIKFKAFKKALSVVANIDTTICNGTGLNLLANGNGGYIGDYLYVWNKDTLVSNYYTPAIKDSSYIVHLHDVCMKEMVIDTVNVVVLDSLTLKVPNDTLICVGNKIDIKLTAIGGKPSQFLYKWDNGIPFGPNQQLQPLKDTLYTIVLSDNCSVKKDTASFRINIRPALYIKTTANDTIACQKQTITLFASAGGGDTFNRKIYWEQANVFADSLKISPTASGWHTATVSDNCGTSIRDSVFVQLLPTLSLTKSNDTLVCLGSKTQVRIAASGGDVGNYQYTWSHSIPDTSRYDVVGDINKVYKISLSDGCSPSIMDSIKVDVMPSLTFVKPRDTTICFGQSTAVSLQGSGGIVANHIFSWNNALGMGSSKLLMPIITTNYEVVLSDGCSVENDTQVFAIAVRDALKINAVATPNEICENEPVQIKLSINGGIPSVSRILDGMPLLMDTMTVFPTLTKNNYLLKVDDGCSNPDSLIVSVIVNPLPQFTFSISKPHICLGDSIEFNSGFTGVVKQYQWTIDDGTTNSNASFFWKPTKSAASNLALLTITDNKNCTGLSNPGQYLSIIERPAPNFDYSPDNPNIDNPTVLFTNNSKFGVTYGWDFGDGYVSSDSAATHHTYSDTGTYKVILTANNALCSEQVSKQIRIKPVYKAFIPTAFSPNGDGKNDGFRPVISAADYYQWLVFDRWGAMLYSTKNIQDFWDGKFNGKMVSDGIYIYIINVRDVNGILHHEEGSFLIIR